MLMAFLRRMGEEDFYQWNNLCLKKLGLAAKKTALGHRLFSDVLGGFGGSTVICQDTQKSTCYLPNLDGFFGRIFLV